MVFSVIHFSSCIKNNIEYIVSLLLILQVKTVTKIIKTREVTHIGPDGKPVTYSYGTLPTGGDYLPYNYANTNVPHDYGTYDPGNFIRLQLFLC